MGLVGCEVAWWLRYRWVEMDTPLAVLPSFPRSSSPSYLSRMMVELAAFLVIFDTLFYYCHRLLHTRAFYKYHKVARIPGTSSGPPLLARSRGRCYCLRSSGGSQTPNCRLKPCHQVDFLLHCVLPVALGPILVRSHLSTTWLWYLVITLHELK